MARLVRRSPSLSRTARYSMNQTIVQVTTTQGKLLGKKVHYANGVQLCAFKGIPYAVPPIGPLRFKPPIPIEKQDNAQECFKDGNECLQLTFSHKFILGSEDCLYLNIYTPSLQGEKYPVMIWLHGGGYAHGSGSENRYSPEYLVAKGVIVVTINSRLGPFGFLSCPEAGIMGNAGLKDQQLALKWISKNITSFGGDPNNVTLFGQSSGASAVHLHLLNQQSRQYFHKTILQSGNAIMDWAFNDNPTIRALQIATIIKGSPVTCFDDVAELLNNANGEDLIRKALATTTRRNWRFVVPTLFPPTIEPDHETAFMSKHPEHLVRSFKNDTHPMIIGYNSYEGHEVMDFIRRRGLGNIVKECGRFVPYSLKVAEPSEMFSKLNEEVRRFYYTNEEFTEANYEPLMKIIFDNTYYMRILEAVELHISSGSVAPIYLYEFDYDGSLTIKRPSDLDLGCKKPAHGDEIFYLFKSKVLGEQVLDNEANKVRDIMCDLWTSFARYGHPTPLTLKYHIKWDPVQNTDFPALQIKATGSEMKIDPEKRRRVAFWKEICQKYSKINSKL